MHITTRLEKDLRLGVLVMSFHQEHFLAEALKSVEQCFDDNDEIVLAVLDSTTESMESIRRILDGLALSIRLVTIDTPPFTTVRVLHETLPSMSSECVVLLSADDALASEYKHEMLDHLAEMTPPVVLNSPLYLTDEHLRTIGRAVPRWSSHDWINRRWLFIENPGKAPGAAIPRQAVVESDFMRIDPRCLIEDFPLWLILRNEVRFRRVSRPIVYYRQHPNSLSRKSQSAEFCWSVGYCIGIAEVFASTLLERLLVRLGRGRWYQQTDDAMRIHVEQGRSSAAIDFG